MLFKWVLLGYMYILLHVRHTIVNNCEFNGFLGQKYEKKDRKSSYII